jgi:putative SOS response-associated peptidase YedK
MSATSHRCPLFTFAGIWTKFNSDRGTKSKPVPVPHQVYGFLTMAPNAVVEPVNATAQRSVRGLISGIS